MHMSEKLKYLPLLLLIPLLGMAVSDEVNWSVFDFVIMGLGLFFLGVILRFGIKKIHAVKPRILFISLALLIFLVLWIELAVGVFGSPIAGQ